MEFSKDSREYQLRKMMCRLWTNFAKFSDPTPNHDKDYSIKWHPARAADKDAKNVTIDYLKIDNDELKMHKNLYEKRINFWREIYEQYNKSFLNPKFH